MGKYFQSNWIYVSGLVILASLLMSSIFQEGMFTGHDIWHQVARFYHYSESVNLGIVPPGWVADLAQGYGYPLFFFSYHLPWLIGLPLIWGGLSVFSTLKLLFFLGFVFSGIAMYYSVNLITKDRLAAFASALIYLIAPHHLFSIFVSASIGTVYQFVFAPLIFTFITQVILSQQKTKYVALLALSVAASTLSHLMLFFFFAPLAAIYALGLLLFLKRNDISNYLQLGFAGFLALCLVAFYLIPTLQLLPQIQAGNSGDSFGQLYRSNFVNLSQLIYSKWGYGPIISNAKDGEISFQVGVFQWLVIVVGGGLVLLSFFQTKSRKVAKLYSTFLQNPSSVTYCLLVGFFCLFWAAILLMLDLSRPVWNLLTQTVSLDYPFRYLLLAVIAASFVFGLGLSLCKSTTLKVVILMSALLIASYTNRNHIHFNLFVEYPLDIYVKSEVTTNTFHEYLPKQADRSLLSESIELKQPGVVIQPIDLTARGWTGLISVAKPQQVLLHQFDFPGQTVFIDHKLVQHTTGQKGLIAVLAPAGTHLIETEYRASLVFIISDAVSLAALLYCIWILIKKAKR